MRGPGSSPHKWVGQAALRGDGRKDRRLAGADAVDAGDGAAKSGGQEVRVGEVFVECAQKTGFPGFGFWAITAPCWAKTAPGGKHASRRITGSKDGAGYMLASTRKSKIKIPDNGGV